MKAKGAARLLAQKAEADAERALAYEGVERLSDPIEALSLLAVEALAMKEALAARVNALSRIRAGAGDLEQLKVEILLYERALDRSAKFLDLLARNNWEQRRIELEQGKAELVVTAFRAALAVVMLLPEDRDAIIRAFLSGIGRGPERLEAQAGEG